MPLNEIIRAIAGFVSPILKDKIQRNETVIKLLHQFKIDPDEHPPADFSGVSNCYLISTHKCTYIPNLSMYSEKRAIFINRKGFSNIATPIRGGLMIVNIYTILLLNISLRRHNYC